MANTLTKSDATQILSDVPHENVFYFYIAEGVYANIFAVSLEDFVAKLECIDERSLLFHFSRNDFQVWIRDIVKDTELAKEMSFIQQDISVEKLRSELLKMVQTRINELKEKFPSSQCNPDGLCLS
jgi:hypothetical protein